MAIRGLISVDDCRLRQQLDRLAFEDSRDMLCWTRPDGSIIQVNQAFCKCLGYHEVKLLDSNLLDLETGSSQDLHARRLREIREQGSITYEIKMLRNDGSAIPLTIDSQLEKLEGEELLLSRATENGWGAKLAFNQLGEPRETQARLEHDDRLRCMGMISAALAHELNQPLAAISNNAYLLQKILDQSEYPLNDAPDLAMRIYEQAKLSAEIVRSIRSFVSDQPPSRASVDINSIIRESLKLVDTPLRQSNIEYRFVLMQSAPQICVDRVQIQQVIVNLILNAIQAICGSDRDKREIIIRSRADENRIEIEIEDTGLGIPDLHVGSLFEPFFSTKPDGMGIGLTICKLIVENHRGRISVTTSSVGTVFTVELPTASDGVENR